jgi:hypothetical protein
MPKQTHGASSATQNLAPDLQYYVCYASSPGAFSDPNPNPPTSQELARLLNIQVTGQPLDESQKNFEVLLMSVGLRAMPVTLSNPVAVFQLADYTLELSGEGFIWKFAVERSVQFHNFTPYGAPGPVGLLVDEIDGVILPSGVRVTTISGSPTGWAKNIAFSRLEFV